MRTLAIAAASIALSVIAQFCLKAGMAQAEVRAATSQSPGLHTVWALVFSPYIVGGFLLYGLGAVAWLAVLAQWDVTKAYPLVGLGFAFTLVVGFFLGEQIAAIRVAGVLLICAGVFLVSRS